MADPATTPANNGGTWTVDAGDVDMLPYRPIDPDPPRCPLCGEDRPDLVTKVGRVWYCAVCSAEFEREE